MADREVTIRIKLDPSQFQSGAGQVTGELQRIEGQGRQTEGAIGGINSALGAIGVGVSLAGAASVVGQLVEIGRQAETAERTFHNLTEPIGGISAALDTLRTSTDFSIADTALEQIGSKALLTGVAGTKEELGKLVEVGSKLGRAMGMDAAEGVDNLNAAILNMSFVRLDQMGLSAAKVRTEMEQLLATGQALNKEDAFKMAVLDQGTQAVERLGDAAQTTYGWLDKLKAQGQNALDAVGKGVGGLANQGAGALLDLQNQLNTPGTALNWLYMNGFIGGGMGRAVQQNNDAQGRLMAIQGQRQSMADWQTMQANIAGQFAFTAEQAPMIAGLSQRDRDYAGQQGALNMMRERNRGRIGGQALFSDEEAVQARNFQISTQAAYDYVKRMVDAAPNIFTDTVVSKWKDAADSSKKMADNIQKGADLLKTASLADFLGQGVNNRATGDLSGMVLNAAKAGGMDADTLQAMQNALDLNSGAQTDASLTVRDKLVPALVDIGAKFGNSAMIDALNKLTAEIQDAKLHDRAPNLSLANLGYAQAGGSGAGYTVQKGDNPSRVAQRLGISVDDVMRMAGISDPRLLQIGTHIGGGGGAAGDIQRIQMPDWLSQQRSGMSGGATAAGAMGQKPMDLSQNADAAKKLADSLTTAATQAQQAADHTDLWQQYSSKVEDLLKTVSVEDLPAAVTAAGDFYKVLDDSRSTTQDIQDAFKDLTSKVQVINVQFKFSTPPDWVTKLISIADLTRANGGKPPGEQ